MEAQARAAITGWVEVRLDAVPGLQPAGVGDLRKRVLQSAIATVRSRAEGGTLARSDADREALLRAATEAGFDAIDVEDRAPFRDGVLAAARRAGVEVVLSRHDLEPAARARDPAGFFERAPLDCLAKYAARVEGAEDIAALVALSAIARGRGLRFAVMGLGDASLRLLAPLLGCDVVYCAPPSGPAAAPGQLPPEIVAAAHASLPSPAPISSRHRLIALLGDPVGHSLSPPMQNAAFAMEGDALVYVAIRAPKARLARVLAGLKESGFAGANATAPLKEAVLPHLDRIDRAAAEARSVNTITASRGRLHGHTTDGLGAVAALREEGVRFRGSQALVLGTGGTGRSVALALRDAGAEVRIANRTAAKAKPFARSSGLELIPWNRAALSLAAQESAILAQCTSLGRDGQANPLPPSALHAGLAVLDAVYHPGGTSLVRQARARGCLTLPGEALLLHQGALSYRLWTGKPAPLGAMRAALRSGQEDA